MRFHSTHLSRLLNVPTKSKSGVGDSYVWSAADVRSYAERLHKAWTDFFEKDIDPWVAALGKKAKGLKTDSIEKDSIIVGDTIGGDFLTADQKAFLGQAGDDMAEFESYRAKIATFDLFGDSPDQAWGKLQVFEKTLNDDRAEFQTMSGRSLKSQKPTSLEDPSKYVDPNAKDKTSIPWTGMLVVGGLVAAAYLVTSFTGLLRISKLPSF